METINSLQLKIRMFYGQTVSMEDFVTQNRVLEPFLGESNKRDSTFIGSGIVRSQSIRIFPVRISSALGLKPTFGSN